MLAAGGDATAVAAAAAEVTSHVTFTTSPEGTLRRSASTDSDRDDAMSTLAKEGASAFADIKADEKVQDLLREEIAPGFEAGPHARHLPVCS